VQDATAGNAASDFYEELIIEFGTRLAIEVPMVELDLTANPKFQ